MLRTFMAFLIVVVCAFHAWSGETVYYNPVAGQLVRSPGGQGVDEARIARAAYIGGATLADVLANPDANPFAPEWVENLNAYPLSGRERSVLAAVYEPVMKNTGSVESTFDSVDSQLAWRGLPTHEIASMGNILAASTTALVAGSLGGLDGATASGKFGFAVNLANGTINNGFF